MVSPRFHPYPLTPASQNSIIFAFQKSDLGVLRPILSRDANVMWGPPGRTEVVPRLNGIAALRSMMFTPVRAPVVPSFRFGGRIS